MSKSTDIQFVQGHVYIVSIVPGFMSFCPCFGKSLIFCFCLNTYTNAHLIMCFSLNIHTFLCMYTHAIKNIYIDARVQSCSLGLCLVAWVYRWLPLFLSLVYVSTCVFMHSSKCLFMHVFMFMLIHVCLCMCLCMCMCIIHAWVYRQYMFVYAQVLSCVFINLFSNPFFFVFLILAVYYVYQYMCVYALVYVSFYACVYIHVNMCVLMLMPGFRNGQLGLDGCPCF